MSRPPRGPRLFPYTTLFRSAGDEAVCREAKADLGDDLVTVAVKRATGPKAAVCRTPAATSQDIRLGVLQGIESYKRRKPFKVAGDRKSTRLNSSHEWISYAV